MNTNIKSAFMLLVASLLPLSVMAYDFMVDSLAYNITGDNTVEVTDNHAAVGYGTVVKNYVGLTEADIPETVAYKNKTYQVTAIGDYAFSSCHDLTKVIIPASVTTIGEDAFSISRNLTEIAIPNSVTTIKDWAFECCSSLKAITIPSSVIEIGEKAFLECYGLESIVVEQGNQAFDSRNGCNAIIETNSSTLIAGCKNTVIPSTVASIGSDAFSGCTGLTSLSIPSSVTSIGSNAFQGCSGLTSMSIPSSVTAIGDHAFAGCKGLNSIIIPTSITTIESSTFWGCSSLTSITIPHSVTTIGEGAFNGCEALTSVTIPNTVTHIDGNVFISCNALEQIVVEQGNQVYDSRNDCNAIIHTSSNSLISGCISTIIPNSVKYIGDEAFRSCNRLTSVVIPYSIIDIGKMAFYCCAELKSVTIPNTVVQIGESAFEGCNDSISLTVTGNGKWNNWSNDFGGDCFNPYSIKTLTVGSEITDMNISYFFQLDRVNSYAEVPPTCSHSAFSTYDAELHVPQASLASYFTAPYWKNFSNINNDLTQKITLSQAQTECTAGETLQLEATATPASIADQVLWSTSNPTVATVDANGLVTTHSKGVCRIYATLASEPAVYASCQIEVFHGDKQIILDQTEATITPNEILTLTPTYDTVDIRNITATSSDPSVALARVVTIDGAKKVQVLGVGLGTATITVASAAGNVPPVTCLITVSGAVMGDMTGDGNVDVSDVNSLINVILSTSQSGETQNSTYDMNHDGKLDVADVNAIINVILRGKQF